MNKCSVQRLSRRKVITFEDTALPRVLNLIDLTALGIGSTIGVGFYVLAGDVARSVAGPAVTVSFLIAGIASLFAGLCYAEFGGRVPKAGSAYIYTYVCIGEFIAFVIGWNLILEYVIGTASIASGFSGYIDAFFDDVISETMRDTMPMNVSFLSEYPDFLAAGLCLLLAAVLAFGVKESSLMNNVVTIINLFVVVYVIITAATKADIDNWSLTPDDLNQTCNVTGPIEGGVNKGWGVGGFVPYGFGGIMQGAATCFYGFVGFDVIASTGEEALRPERNLPIAICLSLFVIFIAYFGMASTLTLAIPYCQQDASAPLIYLYEYFDMNTAKIIVSIGALFGFSASLFGAIFPMPRVIYAMASDGLLFRVMSRVNDRFHSPIIATMVSGSFAAMMAMLFDLEVLVNMMSIGTLQAYTIVALCVMMLRYSLDPNAAELQSLAPLKGAGNTINVERERFPFSSYMRQALNKDKLTKPDSLSTSFVAWATLIFCILCFLTTMFLVVLAPQLAEADPGAIIVCVVFFILSTIVVVLISLQPQSETKPSFMVPLVPWLPALSTFINLYLMCNLPPNTWIKFAIWMAVGLAIYFLYGVCYGPGALSENPPSSKRQKSQDNLGFTSGDGAGVEALAIPTIKVLPATPLPSAANTPQGTIVSVRSSPPPRRSSRDVVVSPLVTAELAEKKLTGENLQMEGVDEEKDGAGSPSSSCSDKQIQAKEDLVLGSAPLVTSVLVASSAERADEHSTDEEKLEKALLERLDNTIDGKSLKSSFDSASEIDTMKSLELGDSAKPINNDGDGVDNAVLASGEGAVKRSRPSVPNLQITDDTIGQPDSLNPSQSAPALPLSSPPGTPTSLPVSKTYSLDDIESAANRAEREKSGGAVSSSVPVTPATTRRQHSTKKLKRMSSFDSIPPSSPDSPFAKRVNDFIVIPVQEPALPSDSGSDEELEGGERKTSTTKSPLPTSVMLELKQKLSSVGSQEGDDAALPSSTSDSGRKDAAKATSSSLDELKGGEKDHLITGLPEPVIVAPTRELRPNSKQFELDTIRERGESRVLAGDDIPTFAGAGGTKVVATASADRSEDQPEKTAAAGTPKVASSESTDRTNDNNSQPEVKVNGQLEADAVRNDSVKPSASEKKESLELPPVPKDPQSAIINNKTANKEESLKQETVNESPLSNNAQPQIAGASKDIPPADSLKPFFDLGSATSNESLASNDVPLRRTFGGAKEEFAAVAVPPPVVQVVSNTAEADATVPKRLSVKDLSAQFLSGPSSNEMEAKPAVERPVSSIAQLRSNFQ